MIIVVLTVILFLVYASLIIFYHQSWISIPEANFDKEKSGKGTSISVIIAARNEENNIGECLTSIALQNYEAHLFETIVIDDHSTDNTAKIVRSFSNKNVSLISLEDFTLNQNLNSYKKKAIEIAISKAKGELIVTTDADCVASSTWLHAIASFYERHDPVFIAAPVAFYKETNFLKIFQTLDFMALQGITGAALHKNFHSMCNGANLAYKKEVFYEVDGFRQIDTIASGDDMLLMHKIHKRYPDRVLFLKSRSAIIKTKPVETVRNFFHQRVRWASKADKYTDKKIIAVLFFVYLFNTWFFVLAFSALFNYRFLYLIFVLLVCKTIIELFFLHPVANFFHKKNMLLWFPFAQPFHILYTVIAGGFGKFGYYEWKERRVK